MTELLILAAGFGLLAWTTRVAETRRAVRTRAHKRFQDPCQ